MIYSLLDGMLASGKVTPRILLACRNSFPVFIQKTLFCKVPFLRALPPKTNVFLPGL